MFAFIKKVLPRDYRNYNTIMSSGGGVVTLTIPNESKTSFF